MEGAKVRGVVAVVGVKARPVVNPSKERPIVVRHVVRGVVTCTKGAALLFTLPHITLGGVVVVTIS